MSSFSKQEMAVKERNRALKRLEKAKEMERKLRGQNRLVTIKTHDGVIETTEPERYSENYNNEK